MQTLLFSAQIMVHRGEQFSLLLSAQLHRLKDKMEQVVGFNCFFKGIKHAKASNCKDATMTTDVGG